MVVSKKFKNRYDILNILIIDNKYTNTVDILLNLPNKHNIILKRRKIGKSRQLLQNEIRNYFLLKKLKKLNKRFNI